MARLHADSWRRHYRGAYSDAFLDGDVVADRLRTWRERLSAHDAGACTILAEADGLIGFAHVIFEHDANWGTLLDNIHVAVDHKRRGIGSRLLALSAQAIIAHSRATGLYLWVLESNRDARAFYEVRGGTRAGRESVSPPGGVAGRLAGAPSKLRYVWPDPATLI